MSDPSNTPPNASSTATATVAACVTDDLPPVRIDHLCYPHILDLVLAYAPRPALLALRRTCRAYRDRADALLAEHVVLDLVSDSSGYDYVRVKSADGGRLPCLAGQNVLFNDTRSANMLGRCAPVLKSTRVVDVRGRMTADVLCPLSRAMPGTTVLRLDGGNDDAMASCPLRTPTVVVFSSLLPARRPRTLLPRLPTIPAHVRRLIVNVAYTNGDPTLPASFIAPYGKADTLDDFVIVFTKLAMTSRVPKLWSCESSDTLGVLHHIIHAMGRHILVKKYTFVGLNELDPVCLGLPGAEPDEVRKQTVAAVDEQLRGLAQQFHLDDEGMEDVRPELCFLSRGEYCDLVGKGQFAVDTAG
ncbi:uncharacterized protein EHS24_001666 [Apiotrichum porosum]|uniref:F-box domain-containing protein n=1 Tax=Apiotrichum porosum TaxID=105984 RepID=A0A427XIS1_9TREE|nr:uncharacterized protein EHS24_001666 [Apiotrichum porosum]RSH78760.1 hypothetical protein EHS24_001666 [Apiotrichum porosum]